MAGPEDKFAPFTVMTHVLTNAKSLREKHPSSLLAISHQRTKHIKRKLYDSTSLIYPSNDSLPSAKKPGEASAAPEMQLVEGKGMETLHLSCPTLPCLRLCLLHKTQSQVTQ